MTDEVPHPFLETFGRIEWVGEWSGPFEVGPQTYDFDLTLPPPRTRTIPAPRQPRETTRFCLGLDDGTVLYLNRKLRDKLVRACFGYVEKEGGGNMERVRECIGTYVIVRGSWDGGYRFERASPPASSWRAA